MSSSITDLAEGISPRCFAARTIPNVPLTGTPQVAAHRRAARSSIMATIPGWETAWASTDDSPRPSPHSRMNPGTRPVGITSIHGVASMVRAVMSVDPFARISSATGSGTRILLAKLFNKSVFRPRQRRISGEALITAASSTRQFSIEIAHVHLKGISLHGSQGEQKIRSTQSRHLRSDLLRDSSLLVPRHGGGQPHFLGKVLWGTAECSKNRLGEFQGECLHFDRVSMARRWWFR